MLLSAGLLLLLITTTTIDRANSNNATDWNYLMRLSNRHRPNTTKLELIQVLFRHGERTPYAYETYPGDPYSESKHFEPWGRGQLTQDGDRHVRQLGRALKRDYRDLMSLGTYAYSFDGDACKASMQAMLSELYGEPTGLEVHSAHEDRDVLLNSRSCYEYRVELERVRRLPEVVGMFDRYRGLYEYLSQALNTTFEPSNRDQRLHELYGVLEIQRGLNLSLPDWCTDGVYDLLREFAELSYNVESYNNALKRLNGGPLLRRMLKTLEHPKARGIRLYVAEDRQLAAFSRALGRNYPSVPGFASAIVLEKRRHATTGKVFARLVVRTEASDKLFPVGLHGCSEDCPLDEFESIVGEAIASVEDLGCFKRDHVARRVFGNVMPRYVDG